VVLADVFCAAAVAIGAFTRGAALLPLAVALVPLWLMRHETPWYAQEWRLLVSGVLLALILKGSGRFSVDHLLKVARLKK